MAWYDFLTGNKPDLSALENEYFRKVASMPIDQRDIFRLRQEAEIIGLPNPPAAALEMQKIMKGDVAFKKAMMGLEENPPTGMVPLDVPLAAEISRATGGRLNYQQAEPMQTPLGFKDNVPMTIQDLIPLLPPSYNELPSPYQAQQPELSLFGPGALSDLPQQITQPYIANEILNKYLGPPKPAGITQIPVDNETVTYITDPITGLPTTPFAIASRFAPAERNIRDAQMGDDVVTIQETTPKSGIYEILTIDGKPVKGPKKPLVELQVDLEGSTKGAIEKEIIDTNKMIGQFNESEKTFMPEFLTYAGQGAAWLQKQADKLGLDSGTKFLEQRTTWMNQSKAAFLQYRKWITGVAGGEREMEEIAKAIPDPERNSPAEFTANLNQSRKWARVLKRWLEDTRTKGLSITQTSEIIESEDKQNINVPSNRKSGNIPPPDWKKTMEIKREFNSDRDMKGMKLGPWTSEGFEVRKDGELMGYYE